MNNTFATKIGLLLKKLLSAFSNHLIWFYIIMCAFAVLFYTIVIANHYFFRTAAFDYAFYNFSYWDFAHFHHNQVPCLKAYGAEKTFMQDHFSLMLIYLVPIYWLIGWLTGSYTILLIEVALIMWSAWALYKLIILKTGDGWLAVFAVLYYFLLQGRYSAFAADANILTMACCLVPLFLYYFESGKFIAAAIIFTLSMFAREDMPLWFIFIFLVMITWHWKEKKLVRVCLIYIAASILYFVLLFKVFIPATETPGHHYSLFNYSALGPDPFHALVFIITHPIKALQLLYINQTGQNCYAGIKTEFYLVYFISGGFMLFYRPKYFIWFIPIIAQKVLNDEAVRWGIASYYSITIVTMLPVSVFLIISVIKQKAIKYILSAIVCAASLYITIYKMDKTNLALDWFYSMKGNMFSKNFFNPNYNTPEIHKQLKTIPTDAKVCASSSLLPHLSQRPFAYEFPDVEDADYIAAFSFRDYYVLPDSTYTAELNKYILSPDWNIVSASHNFVLLKKEPNQNLSGLFICNKKNLLPDSIANNLFNPSFNLLFDGDSNMYLKKEPNQNKHITHLVCDAEKFTTNRDTLLASEGSKIETGGFVTDEKAHSGKYSVRLRFLNPYGMGSGDIPKLKAGDVIKITAWRYTTTGNGCLAIQLGKEGNVVVYSKPPTVKDTNGWEYITVSALVPEGVTDALCYMWDNGNKPIYVDDLNIYIYRW